MGFNYNDGVAATQIEPFGQLYMNDYFEQIRIVVFPEIEHAERMYIAAPATTLEEANHILKNAR